MVCQPYRRPAAAKEALLENIQFNFSISHFESEITGKKAIFCQKSVKKIEILTAELLPRPHIPHMPHLCPKPLLCMKLHRKTQAGRLINSRKGS